MRGLAAVSCVDVEDGLMFGIARDSVLMALGELDWSKPSTNDNELFNPGGSLWTWQDVNAILKQRKENQ